MSDVSVFVVRDDALLAFTRPAIDLSTGQIVELAPAVDPVQLELAFEFPS